MRTKVSIYCFYNDDRRDYFEKVNKEWYYIDCINKVKVKNDGTWDTEALERALHFGESVSEEILKG